MKLILQKKMQNFRALGASPQTPTPPPPPLRISGYAPQPTWVMCASSRATTGLLDKVHTRQNVSKLLWELVGVILRQFASQVSWNLS